MSIFVTKATILPKLQQLVNFGSMMNGTFNDLCCFSFFIFHFSFLQRPAWLRMKKASLGELEIAQNFLTLLSQARVRLWPTHN